VEYRVVQAERKLPVAYLGVCWLLRTIVAVVNHELTRNVNSDVTASLKYLRK